MGPFLGQEAVSAGCGHMAGLGPFGAARDPSELKQTNFGTPDKMGSSVWRLESILR